MLVSERYTVMFQGNIPDRTSATESCDTNVTLRLIELDIVLLLLQVQGLNNDAPQL
jgi:hypothetical protein